MRGALHVHKTIVDEIGRGLREAGDSAVAGCFGGFGNFGELGEIRNVGAGSDPIEMLFEQIGANGIEFAQRHAAGFGSAELREPAPRIRLRFAGGDDAGRMLVT